MKILVSPLVKLIRLIKFGLFLSPILDAGEKWRIMHRCEAVADSKDSKGQ